MTTFAWLVEAPGPSWLATRRLGNYEFYWTDDPNKALRFCSIEQADTTMMTVFEMRRDLFPPAFIRAPRAVEHAWLPPLSVEHSAAQTSPSKATKAGA